MRRCWVLAALVIGGAGCRDDPAPGSDDAIEPDSTTSAASGGTTSESPEPIAGDVCADAAPLLPGTVAGTLRSKNSAGGGACGMGGPDAFFVLDVPRRSDVALSAVGRNYEPVIGVLPTSCVLQWDTRALACIRGIEGWVTDVAAGTRLIVVVGIPADDPALQTFAADDIDPLDFELSVRLREVLLQGDPCGPDRDGRCEGGTACLLSMAEDTGGSQSLSCQRLDADTCASAAEVAVQLGSGEVVVPADAVHTDAHAHACGGDRSPERVFVLQLPADAPADATLELSAPGAHVLAVRPENCDPAAELACDDARDGEPAFLSLAVAQVPASGRITVFVELPPEPQADGGTTTGGEEAPITLRWDLVDTDGG